MDQESLQLRNVACQWSIVIELYSLAIGILKYILDAPFTVEVNDKPLEYLKTNQIKNTKLLRFLLRL